MEVVSVTDGKNLGRVFDVVFTFPEGQLNGFYVTGSKGFKLTKSDEFICAENIVKIGEDVILIRAEASAERQLKRTESTCLTSPNTGGAAEARRNFEEYE